MDKMVWVKWIDSAGDGRWNDRKALVESLSGADCESVGWLIHENDKVIILALSVNNKHEGTDEVNGSMAIPKFAITSMRQLRFNSSAYMISKPV